MHESKASEIMRTVNSYIQTIYAGAGARGVTGNGKHTIELDSEGCPIAPSPASWDKIMKVELEMLYRNYVTYQYRKFIKATAASQ